jgi:hypothetical protein
MVSDEAVLLLVGCANYLKDLISILLNQLQLILARVWKIINVFVWYFFLSTRW